MTPVQRGYTCCAVRLGFFIDENLYFSYFFKSKSRSMTLGVPCGSLQREGPADITQECLSTHSLLGIGVDRSLRTMHVAN